MRRITPELINYIVEKLVREIQPEKIILFGSYARGDFDRDSDLDLFLFHVSRKCRKIPKSIFALEGLGIKENS